MTVMYGWMTMMDGWMTMNHEERLARVEEKCQGILSPIRSIEGLQTEMLTNVIGHQPLGVRLRIDSDMNLLNK